jgi:hypothetical protein
VLQVANSDRAQTNSINGKESHQREKEEKTCCLPWHALRSGTRQAPRRRLSKREIAVEKQVELCPPNPAAFVDCDIGPFGIPIAPSHHASLLIFFVAIHGLYFFPREKKPPTDGEPGDDVDDQEAQPRTIR